MVRIDATQDYYRYLGISVDADAREIHRAYRTAAREYHPDRATGDEKRFREVQEAWDVLGDPVCRKAYDSQRQARGLQAKSPVSLDVMQNSLELAPLSGSQMLYAVLVLQPTHSELLHHRKLNLALVIDRSTSMLGDRMRQVQLAANDMLEILRPDDFISLVTYSDRAEVVASSMPAENVISLKSAIASISPSGGTEIYKGLVAGVSQIYKNYDRNFINHIILMTDGRTYGDEAQTITLAKQLAQQGIGVTAFGIGEDWNDRFLDEVASLTGCTARYISKPGMVREVLRDQVNEMSSLIMKNARLTINTAEYVKINKVYRATPHMQTMNLDEDDSAYVGGITVGEPSIFAVEFLIKQFEVGERRISRIDLHADDIHTGSEIAIHRDIYVLFKLNPEITAPSPRMLNILTRLNVYQLQESAWRAYERGDAVSATRMLQSAATRLFDMGYEHLGKAAMLEVDRLSKGSNPSDKGRKEIRYGTRALSIPTT